MESTIGLIVRVILSITAPSTERMFLNNTTADTNTSVIFSDNFHTNASQDYSRAVNGTDTSIEFNQTHVINTTDSLGATPLILAVQNGDEERVQNLIKNGENVNAVDNLGRTALHLAAQYGQEEIAEILIMNGANVNTTDNRKRTALHYIAIKDHNFTLSLDIVSLLMKNGINTSAIDVDNRTALHLAVIRGMYELVHHLVENGVFLNGIDIDGKTPLYYAADRDYDWIVETLLKHGALVRIGESPIKAAIRNHDKEMEKMLTEHVDRY